ncbi:hypothetical protein [Ruminococcus sp.]|uniref:hypothetical protein n=1 Tax=Ruminococcus sp. TaxID=41978 RepID=UPI0025F9BC2B|nr:hypothetical protein [Ruminococcus sp.]MBQ8966755.1 hypothetical protein [Ruminococcus sp.]
MNLKRLWLSAALSASLLFCGCADKNTEGTVTPVSHDNSTAETSVKSFYDSWEGETITAETARENGCVMLGDGVTGEAEWKDFLIDIGSSEKAEMTVCTENSVMLVSESSSGSTALIQIKEKDGDRIVSHGRLVSPVEVCCVRNDETESLDYYLSDCLLYTVPLMGEEGYGEVPAEFSVYSVSADAAVTFPYQKCFSTYGDFSDYYDKYHDSLGLDVLKDDMSAYDAEGGFNTHVVFLYGDMSGGSAEYSFLRAVEEGGQLTVYLKRNYTKNSGAVSKWQLTCAFPSEYLSEIAPDAVTWVIYDDEESRG